MGWEDEFTYLQVGCSLPGLYMSLYHVVYLLFVGTWQSVTGAGKKNAGLCGYHWCNDALCQRQGKDPVDPVIRFSRPKNLVTHPMFLQKNMFRLNEWFISLPKNYIYFSWKSISFFNPPEESQTWRLDMYVYLLYIQTWFDKTIQQMSDCSHRIRFRSGLW